MHLATYLNDHLAGSMAALDLLEHLQATHPERAQLLKNLYDDIDQDRKELVSIISRLGMSQSAIRQAASWLAEKFARLKMRLDDLSGGNLRLLESLDALALGIYGKESMWRALKVVPAASGPDYDHFIARAKEQRGRVEGLRLDAAREALVIDS